MEVCTQWRGRCTKLRAAASKQATLIEIPDGFVFPGILSRSMSLSVGEWLGGEHTICILNQSNLRKWAGQRTVEEEWGMRWKHINLSPSNLACHDFQTPSQRAEPAVTTYFAWVIQTHNTSWKLQPSSYHHIQSQALIVLLRCKQQSQTVHPQAAQPPCLPWLNSSDSGEAAVQKASLSPWTVLPLQPDRWHVK